MKRLALALGAAALTLLVVQGALVWFLDRSLFGAPSRPAPPDPNAPGLYRVDPDPLVGYMLRANEELAILDGTIHSDALGLRRRAGPPLAGDVLRICVLGDSVVFGFGIDDDETLAHHLEQELAAARPSDARPALCRTVAIPGWNHRNAVHFLLNHMEELDPDIVLYMPIVNDLFDTDGVTTSGRRRAARDPASPEPMLAVSQVAGLRFTQQARERLADDGLQDIKAWMGPPALHADLSPGSSDRFEQNVDSIERLADALDARGARLALLQYQDEAYVWYLRRRLTERGRELLTIPLFTRVPSELTLGFDPHPNREGARLMARWIAGELLLSGVVPGGDASTARALSGERADLRASLLSPTDTLLRADVVRLGQWRSLHHEIDFLSLKGVAQILGGVNADGSVGTRALFLLARGGASLEVELAPLADSADLLPLEVAVEIDGQRVGSLRLTGEESVSGRFAVPPSCGPHAEPLEVRLLPDRWVTRRLPRGSQLVSFRPLRLACPPD